MMVEVHSPETPAIVAAYDFSQFKHIVDVGGGHGMLLSAIIAAHPGVRGTLFDLQEGVDAAKRGEGGPLPGVTFIAGDVFEDVPEGADALSVPASSARLRRRRLPEDASQRAPGHEAGCARAGAGRAVPTDDSRGRAAGSTCTSCC